MTDFKTRQKSREKFTTVGFAPSQMQPMYQPMSEPQPQELLRPPHLMTVDLGDDRRSNHSKRSNSTKQRKKESSLMGAGNDGGAAFAFEPVNVDRFKNVNLETQPVERQRSEASKRSGKKKSKDAMLVNLDENRPKPLLTSPSAEALLKYGTHKEQSPEIVYKQPQAAPTRQVYDLTSQQPTEANYDRVSNKSSEKRKPKENSLLGMVAKEKTGSMPFVLQGLGKKLSHQVKSPETLRKLDESEVHPLQVDSKFERQNHFVQQDSKISVGERKRKEANRLGNLFEERNKSRSIQNISKITESDTGHRSRLGELFKEKRAQESKLQSSRSNNFKMESIEKRKGDNEEDFEVSSDSMDLSAQKQKKLKMAKAPVTAPFEQSRKPVGAELCQFAEVFKVAQPLTMKFQPTKQPQKKQEDIIYKDDAPAFIPGPVFVPPIKSPTAGATFNALHPSNPTLPSIPSLAIDNTEYFNEKNSILKYSQSPRESNVFKDSKKDSFMFQLEADEKIAESRRKKKGLAVTSNEQPRQKQEDSERHSQHSTSKQKGKKVKETTLQFLTKPSDQKYFDFRVQNSPNRPNDSFYEQPAPVEPIEPSPRQSPMAPNVITFQDQPVRAPVAHISKTTDNFYPDARPMNSSSCYEPSVQSAQSSVRHTYSRPPSCKKSASSKRSSSKDGSLLDAMEQPKRMTLNELAMMKRGTNNSQQQVITSQKDSYDSGSRKSRSNSKKKESCLMQYFHSDSEDGSQKGGSQRGGSQASSHKSKSSKGKPEKKDSMLMTGLRQDGPVKKAKQSQLNKPEQKTEVIKRNYYHIDANGNLIKGDVFIPVGGSRAKQSEPDYFQSGYAGQYERKFTDNGSVRSGSKKSQGSRKSRSRDKGMMVDSSRVSHWLPSQKTSNRLRSREKVSQVLQRQSSEQRIRYGGNQSKAYHNQSSLDEFIKPVGVSTRQGAGAFYLQEYLQPKEPAEPKWTEDNYYQEERVRFNDMFDKKGQRKKMRRTET